MLEAIADAEVLLICPSNPIVSIGPILALRGLRRALREAAAIEPIRAAALAGLGRFVRERRAALYLSMFAATFGAVALASVLKIKVINARYLMCAFPVFIAVSSNF